MQGIVDGIVDDVVAQVTESIQDLLGELGDQLAEGFRGLGQDIVDMLSSFADELLELLPFIAGLL